MPSGASCKDLTAGQLAQRAGISSPTLVEARVGRPRGQHRGFFDVARALGFSDQFLDAVDPLQTELGKERAGRDIA